jgi:DNA-directed RNA polymerase II subunit RPB2
MEVLDKFFKSNRYFISKHHLDSYDDFVSNKLMNTIKVLNPITVLKNQENGIISHEIEIFVGGVDSQSVYLKPPTFLPNEARLRDLTYAAEMYADILVRYTTHNKSTGTSKVEESHIKDVRIGTLPIMLHSRLCVLRDKTPQELIKMGECPKDIGGYFVIDGKEKVIVAQERIATNRIFINQSGDDKYSYSGMVRCTSRENPLFPKTIHIHVRKDELKTPEKREAEAPRNSIVVEIPGFTDQKEKSPLDPSLKRGVSSGGRTLVVPLFVLFRALGIESDKDIIQHIVPDMDASYNKKLLEFLYFSVLNGRECTTQEAAIKYLANRVEYQNEDRVNHILMHDVFPNMGTSYAAKALFLGHVVNKILRVAIGAEKESDRDNYLYKRVDISGFLIGNLFRDYYNQFRNMMRNRIDQQYLYGPWRTSSEVRNLVNKTNFYKIFDGNIITNGMIKSLKGSWGRSMIEESVDPEKVKQGLVQDLARISYMGFTSHLRRVNTPIDPTSKVVAPHRLHPTQWGVMCPAESPDGGSIGLLKNFAIMCHVTFDAPVEAIEAALKRQGVLALTSMCACDMSPGRFCKVMINSNWIGLHDAPDKLFAKLKQMKRTGEIDKYTSISWDVFKNELNILTEAGRCTRPLFVVRDGALVYDPVKHANASWDELISAGVIEYMDVEEIGYAYVAMWPRDIGPRHTHCELHPSTIFSVVTHNIPLANHNQAPRNVFFGAQGKQAIGVYATNYNNRIDTMSYVLNYPQRAIVGTRYMDYIGNNALPAGNNLIVAIASYLGYNQEDGIMINRAAIERGCFNLTYFKNFVESEDDNKRDNEQTVFANPLKMTQEGVDLKNIKFARYGSLDDNGFPRINTYISEGDAIIGKTLIKKELKEDKDKSLGGLFDAKVVAETYMDKTIVADKTVEGIIDRVFVYTGPAPDNAKRCKIRMRKNRIPELGDKMSSRHGQKGVVGYIVNPEDMPFNHEHGIVPDIIINPHAIPSRMTIGHLLECVLAKAGVQMGCMVDATPFCEYDYDALIKALETKFGMERYGNEVLYDAKSGKQMETDIFFGPTYYQRLKHMVGDKINYRMRGGPITVRTRQPTKGRSAGGALRLGEMEFHCNFAHGVSSFMKESLVDRSDDYVFYVDNRTGDILAAKPNGDPSLAQYKGDELADVSMIRAPYSMKLLIHEMMALGVKAQFITNPEDIPEEEFEGFDDVELEAADADIAAAEEQ